MSKAIKDLTEKEGWQNRHLQPLPATFCDIMIIEKGDEFLCAWHPFKEELRTDNNDPAKGYLGTAKVISGQWKGIGFHAWEQNNSEFIYYKIIKP